MEEWRLRLPQVIVILQNSVRPGTEFLIGAVKLQLSITSQMCHLDSFLLRENAKYGFVHGEVVSFDSAFEKILEIFQDLVCLAY